MMVYGTQVDYSIDDDDYQIGFMHQSSLPLQFTWPKHDEFAGRH
jgi:hypothetical protein